MNTSVALVLGVAVNVAWGFSYLVPRYLPGVDAVLLTAGRFLVYGLFSLALLLSVSRGALRRLRRAQWLWALAFAFAGNVGYYAAIVAAVHLAGVAVPALIDGALPVTMAVYASCLGREVRLSRLSLPLALILAGVLLMNGIKVARADSAGEALSFAGGVLFSLVALALWTWYGVANGNLVKSQPDIDEAAWSSAVGVCTLLLLVLFLPLTVAVGVWSPDRSAALLEDRALLTRFVLASLGLGLVNSWLAGALWYSVSRALPVAASGQLLVVTPISSVLLVSLVEWTPPPLEDLLGLALVVPGVWLGVSRSLAAESDGPEPVGQPAPTIARQA